MRADFYHLLEKYSGFKQIYTDGSKDGSLVSCAMVSDDLNIHIRFPVYFSVYTAELIAINKALSVPSAKDVDQDILIISDTLSLALLPLYILALITSVFLNLCRSAPCYNQCGISIVFIQCPIEVRIAGNERVDDMAKQALCLSPFFC